jgi:hypothetical protein
MILQTVVLGGMSIPVCLARSHEKCDCAIPQGARDITTTNRLTIILHSPKNIPKPYAFVLNALSNFRESATTN